MSADNANLYELFFLLDPQNFKDGSDIDDVIEACVEADCFHPCYGAQHESSCNSCSNGFSKFLVLKKNDQIDDEQLWEYITILKETCNKCQVPHTKEITIPETKPIDETPWSYLPLNIPPLTAYYPKLCKDPWTFREELEVELNRKRAKIDAISLNPNGVSDGMDSFGDSACARLDDWSCVTDQCGV